MRRAGPPRVFMNARGPPSKGPRRESVGPPARRRACRDFFLLWRPRRATSRSESAGASALAGESETPSPPEEGARGAGGGAGGRGGPSLVPSAPMIWSSTQPSDILRSRGANLRVRTSNSRVDEFLVLAALAFIFFLYMIPIYVHLLYFYRLVNQFSCIFVNIYACRLEL